MDKRQKAQLKVIKLAFGHDTTTGVQIADGRSDRMRWNDEGENVIRKALSNLDNVANNKDLHQTGIKVKNPLLRARNTRVPK